MFMPSVQSAASRSVQPIKLSVLIRAFNEQDRIRATIESALPLRAEIVVVINAASTDATAEIARSLGAKVYFNSWSGFGPQRNWGEEKCCNDFVFSLDADEVLTPALVEEIRHAFMLPHVPRLMIVRKAVVFPHHKKPPPLGFCHEQILIYDRRIARTGPNPDWDKLDILASDKPYRLKHPLWHFSYRDWNHVVSKLNYMAELAAGSQRNRSRYLLILRLIFEFPFSFIKFYFFRRYFLGGADGFILATCNAFGRFLRIAKMLERSDHKQV